MKNAEILNVLKDSLQIADQKEIFTDELLEKLSVVFEAKINEHKSVVAEEVKAELEEYNKAEISEFKSELTTQLDEYLNFFVEKFLDENQEQIHEDVKVKTAEKVLEKFEGIVQLFNIELDESTISQDEEIDNLKEELNEAVNYNIALENEVREFQKAQVIAEEANKIKIESERATFIKLAKNFDFLDEDSFKSKMDTLSESINISKKGVVELEEQEVTKAQQNPLEEKTTIYKQQPTSHYLKYLSA